MSVRARITLVAAVVVFAVLSAAALLLVDTQERVLLSGTDDILLQRADDIEALLAAGTVPEFLASRDIEDALAQVVRADGSVIVASPRAADEPPLGTSVTAQRIQTTDLPLDDEPFRLLSRPVTVRGEPAVLHVATVVELVTRSRASLVGTLLVGLPLITLALAVMVYVLVGRALAPIVAIQEQVRSITAGDLSQRVPEPGTTDEVGQLARLMNGMLGRLEAAAVQQRRFVGDAAHELRSPLARMRSQLEVDEAHPETADTSTSNRVLLSEALDMQHLIDDLLFLARRDEGATTLQLTPVALDVLVRDVAEEHQAAVEVRTQPMSLEGDADRIRRALQNLLDNAARHAHSRIELTLAQTPAGVEIAVADDGPGIPPADRQRVFERFARVDDSRTRTDGGTGLGLAIVREIAHAHGGDVHVDGTVAHGARVVLTLPTDVTTG